MSLQRTHEVSDALLHIGCAGEKDKRPRFSPRFWLFKTLTSFSKVWFCRRNCAQDRAPSAIPLFQVKGPTPPCNDLKLLCESRQSCSKKDRPAGIGVVDGRSGVVNGRPVAVDGRPVVIAGGTVVVDGGSVGRTRGTFLGNVPAKFPRGL